MDPSPLYFAPPAYKNTSLKQQENLPADYYTTSSLSFRSGIVEPGASVVSRLTTLAAGHARDSSTPQAISRSFAYSFSSTIPAGLSYTGN